jgi:hypothetical protein
VKIVSAVLLASVTAVIVKYETIQYFI